MKRLSFALLPVLTFLLVACGSDSPTGPSVPALGGVYVGIFSAFLTNSLQSASEFSTVTVTLNDADTNGDFTGRYVVPNGGGSGVLEGILRADGGITITEFGDPNVSPGQAVLYLQNAFWWCNFTAAASSGFSGDLVGNTVTIGGSLGLPCHYQNPTQTVSSTVSTQIAVTR